MGKRPFVRFYHMDWASSGDVQDMSMQEVGVYWTLLVRQMVDGYVTKDRNKLRRVFNVDTVEEVDALLSEKVMIKFVDVPDAPDRMYNRRLEEVIVETDAASNRNTANIRSRYDQVKAPPISAGFTMPPTAAPLDLNYEAVIKEYPKLGMDKPGSSSGIQQMYSEVRSEEDLALLIAAARRYANENKGQPQRFIKSFSNFMREWREWIPKKMARHLSVVEQSPTPAPQAQPPAPSKPPWEDIEPGTSQTVREGVEMYWTEERKREWYATNNQEASK